MRFWRLFWPFETKSATVDARLIEALRGAVDSAAGPAITVDSAMRVTTVLRCVRVLANGVAQAPLKLYRPGPEGRGSAPAIGHPLYRLLNLRPNSLQNSYEFLRTLVFHRALAGQAICYKLRAGGGLRELIPLNPLRVEVKVGPDRTRSFRYLPEHGGTAREFADDEIWYLPDLSWGDRAPLRGIDLAREAIGLSLAAERTHADHHRNGIQTSGVLAVQGKLTDERHDRLEAWLEAWAAKRRFRPLIVDQSAKYDQTQMTGVDAQHVELRKLEIEEICRAFDVFPQMVGHAGDQTPTFASAEQFFIAHVVHTLTPWYRAIEQSLNVSVIEPEGDPDLFAKFNERALLRGAMKDEAETLARALGSGGHPAWITQNEARELVDRNPLPGGDELPKLPNQPESPPQPEDSPDDRA